MRFSRKSTVIISAVGTICALTVAGLVPQAALAQGLYAVVPTATIYPGEVITSGHVTEVEVTNPRIAAGYATDLGDVVGKVSKRTLVAGRTIQIGSLRDPYTVERGTTVRMTAKVGGLAISAAGTPLQDAMIGDVIRVRNLDTGVIVSGTVMADGTIEVMQK